MRAGGLDERITIQKTVTETGPYGGSTETTQDVATLWAKVVHQKGDESFAAAQEYAEVAVKFKTRFIDGIDATMRVAWRGRTFDIHDVDLSRRRADELWVTAIWKG